MVALTKDRVWAAPGEPPPGSMVGMWGDGTEGSQGDAQGGPPPVSHTGDKIEGTLGSQVGRAQLLRRVLKVPEAPGLSRKLA